METLNKRREQECSQHSATQRVRYEIHSQEVRDILLGDLWWAIIAIKEQGDKQVAVARGSLFTWEICEAPLLEGFKLPNIKAYEGKVDP